MKFLQLLLLFFISISLSLAQSDGITEYFEKYQEDDRFTVVYLSPKMFEIASKAAPEELNPEVKEMIAKSKGLRILMTEETPLTFFREADNILMADEYESLLTVRSEEDNVKILVKDNEDGTIIKDLVIVVGSDEFVLVSFSGELDLETISKMIDDMGKLDFNKAEDIANMEDMDAEIEAVSPNDLNRLNKDGLDITSANQLGIEGLKVYPNPNIGMFTLNFNIPNEGQTLVKLFGSSGQMVYSKDLGNYKGSFSKDLDIVTEGPGIYFLLIQQNGESFTRKIIVSRN